MNKLMMLVITFFISCCANAAWYGEMPGTPFPEIDPPGPVHQSKRYVLQTPIEDGKAEFDLILDTPPGAHVVALGEPEAEFELEHDLILDSPIVQGFDSSELKAMSLGRFFDVTHLQPGVYSVSASGLSKQKALSVAVAQPQSPLLLRAQIRPLAVNVGQRCELMIFIDDEQPVQSATVTVVLPNKQKIIARRVGDGQYKVTVKAPKVTGRKSVGVKVLASGQRFDESPFVREITTRMMVIEALSGIDAEVEVDSDGGLAFDILPATGSYRVDVFYGFEGKSIAWARESFYLDDEGRRVRIPRPQMASVADKALVKLLNMDTLGLEDAVMVDLPPDLAARETFVMPSLAPIVLPERKRKALEALQ